MSALSKRQISEGAVAPHYASTAMSAADAARFAVANTVIEGGFILPETEAALEKWVAGELTDEQLVEFGWSSFGTRR